MAQLKNYREVGIFDLLSAPLNPIGAFDAEQFKKDVRALLDSQPEDKFVAVDLTGLDFLYSDAYSALLQFHQELSVRGGIIAVLSDNKIVVDGLRKSGLDKSVRIFANDSEMMSFSLHSHNSGLEQDQVPVDEPQRQGAVASQNMTSAANESEEKPRSERRTGHQRRFTKSFNAITKDDKMAKKGLDMLFEEEKSPAKTIIFFLLLVAAVGGVLAFLLM